MARPRAFSARGEGGGSGSVLNRRGAFNAKRRPAGEMPEAPQWLAQESLARRPRPGAPRALCPRFLQHDVPEVHDEHGVLGRVDVAQHVPRHGHDIGHLAGFERAHFRLDAQQLRSLARA